MSSIQELGAFLNREATAAQASDAVVESAKARPNGAHVPA
jgi:hypothetical protein